MVVHSRNSRKKLIKFGGKVLTVGYAVKCASIGFRGCSPREKVAVKKVLSRLAKKMGVI